MGILNKKEESQKESKKQEKSGVVKTTKETQKSIDTEKAFQKYHLKDVIRRPVITEKATEKTAESVYVFEVADSANKVMVREAFKSIYNVDPIKIRTTRKVHRKTKRFGRKSSEKGAKKAYVYLKKGEEIELV